MIAYEAIGPTTNGYFLVAYATPGAPAVLTVAGMCPSEKTAKDECARLNEAQVTERREEIVRKANAIVRDLHRKVES